MDRELSADFQRKQRIKSSLKILGIAILLLVLILGFREVLKPNLKRNQLRTAIAEIGDVQASITASGTVRPEIEQVLTSPITSKIDTVFFHAGQMVKKNQSILVLNKEFILLEYERLNDELELAKNRKNKLKLDMDRQLIDLQTKQEIKKLQIESLKAARDQKKRLYEIGAGDKNAFLKAQLDYEIAKHELKQFDMQLDNQNRALQTDLLEMDLEIRIQAKKIEELSRQIELAEARAEKDGVITWANEAIGSTVHKGDVTARIADLRTFKIEAKISDLHASKLRNGGMVSVRINDLELSGLIASIEPTVQNGIITFQVILDEKDHSALRPNLRVDVYVITSMVKDAVRVKNGPFVNGSGKQEIFIIQNGKALRKKVDIGAVNFDYVELKDQIQTGDEIIISNMKDYIHVAEIELDN